MSAFLDVKHKIKEIASRREFENLLEASTMRPIEKTTMRACYLEGKNFYEIAEETGYSMPGIRWIHKQAVNKAAKLLP